jgi:hypothetical protein
MDKEDDGSIQYAIISTFMTCSNSGSMPGEAYMIILKEAE